jgi:hypothetical protein
MFWFVAFFSLSTITAAFYRARKECGLFYVLLAASFILGWAALVWFSEGTVGPF